MVASQTASVKPPQRIIDQLRDAVDESSLSCSVKGVVRGILKFCDAAKLETWTGVNRIAHIAGVADRTVRTMLAKLISAGAVIRVGRQRWDGSTTTSLLSIVPNKMLAFLGVSDQRSGGADLRSAHDPLPDPLDQMNDHSHLENPPYPPFAVPTPHTPSLTAAEAPHPIPPTLTPPQADERPESHPSMKDAHTPEPITAEENVTNNAAPSLFAYAEENPEPLDCAKPTGASESSGRPEKWACGRDIEDPAGMQRVAVAVAEAITGRKVDPKRGATLTKPVVTLWRALGRPDYNEFERDVRLVAEWAKVSKHRLAARDIRAEGWDDGIDRSKSVTTICVQRRFLDRLEAAQEWAANGKRDGAETVKQSNPTTSPEAERMWTWLVKKAGSSSRHVVPTGTTDEETRALRLASSLRVWMKIMDGDPRFLQRERAEFIAAWMDSEE